MRGPLAILLAMLAEPSWAYRPLATEDAALAPAGKLQLESSWDHARLEDGGSEDVLLLVPGARLGPRLELSAELPFVHAAAPGGPSLGGAGDLKGALKAVVFEQEGVRPALSARLHYKGANGKAADRRGTGYEEYALLAIGSLALGRWQLNAHAGPALTRGSPLAQDHVQYAAAIDCELAKAPKPLYVLTELYGQSSPDRLRRAGPLSWFAGLRYEPIPLFSVDSGFAVALAGAAPDWRTTLGLTAAF